MKITVECPNVVFREGPEAVSKLARSLEEIGYDQIDMFDHVVMAHEKEGRTVRYGSKMPVLEALTTLGFLAAATERIGLGTEVLVVPQRQALLVAKQISTLDTLSGGRIRLGVGVGWQDSEYEALGNDFKTRGRALDEAIELFRHSWADDPVDFKGDFNRIEAMAMELKPPQGRDLPIWVGGGSPAALRRTGKLGDGWLAMGLTPDQAAEGMATIRKIAEEAGRDPDRLGFQSAIAMPPRPGSDADKSFYAEPDRVADAAAALQEVGVGWTAVNGTGIFLAGARSVDAMVEAFGELHGAIRKKVGS